MGYTLDGASFLHFAERVPLAVRFALASGEHDPALPSTTSTPAAFAQKVAGETLLKILDSSFLSEVLSTELPPTAVELLESHGALTTKTVSNPETLRETLTNFKKGSDLVAILSSIKDLAPHSSEAPPREAPPIPTKNLLQALAPLPILRDVARRVDTLLALPERHSTFAPLMTFLESVLHPQTRSADTPLSEPIKQFLTTLQESLSHALTQETSQKEVHDLLLASKEALLTLIASHEIAKSGVTMETLLQPEITIPSLSRFELITLKIVDAHLTTLLSLSDAELNHELLLFKDSTDLAQSKLGASLALIEELLPHPSSLDERGQQQRSEILDGIIKLKTGSPTPAEARALLKEIQQTATALISPEKDNYAGTTKPLIELSVAIAQEVSAPHTSLPVLSRSAQMLKILLSPPVPDFEQGTPLSPQRVEIDRYLETLTRALEGSRASEIPFVKAELRSILIKGSSLLRALSTESPIEQKMLPHVSSKVQALIDTLLKGSSFDSMVKTATPNSLVPTTRSEGLPRGSLNQLTRFIETIVAQNNAFKGESAERGTSHLTSFPLFMGNFSTLLTIERHRERATDPGLLHKEKREQASSQLFRISLTLPHLGKLRITITFDALARITILIHCESERIATYLSEGLSSYTRYPVRVSLFPLFRDMTP